MDDKWVQNPRPSVSPEIQKELTRLGGTIPNGCGELSGEPLFRLVWAPDELEWKNGKLRLRFLQRQRRIRRHYVCTEEMFTKLHAFDVHSMQERRASYMALDLAKAFLPHETTPYIQSNFTEQLDYITLDPTVRPEGMLTYPQFPRYYRDADFLQQIGKEEWKVLRWMPTPVLRDTVCPHFPTMLDDEKTWTDLRYDKGYYPETGEERMLDRLGPYPQFGSYEHECISLEPGEMPTEKNILGPLRAYLQARDAVTARWEDDKAFREACTLEEAMLEFEQETLGWQNDMWARIEDARPSFKDTHVTVPAMPPAGEPVIKVVGS